MVSLAPIQTSVKPVEPIISPRISFSTDLLDESEFISISLSSKETDRMLEKDNKSKSIGKMDFEFLSNNDSTKQSMITADELFLNGKLLPFWHVQAAEKLQQINLNEKDRDHQEELAKEDQKRVSTWFIDDDPSPRPPKCTVLWKELLRLRKQRASTLSPSSSSSSSSSSGSLDMSEKKESSDRKPEKQVKRAKKGLERTRSASIRIRPMVNVPICTQGGKSSALPPFFPLKKGRSEETRVRK